MLPLQSPPYPESLQCTAVHAFTPEHSALLNDHKLGNGPHRSRFNAITGIHHYRIRTDRNVAAERGDQMAPSYTG